MAAEMSIVKKDIANPYLKRYFEAKNLKEGDPWSTVGYMSWIDSMHDMFRYEQGLIPDIPYTKDEQDVFLDWLSDRISREKK